MPIWSLVKSNNSKNFYLHVTVVPSRNNWYTNKAHVHGPQAAVNWWLMQNFQLDDNFYSMGYESQTRQHSKQLYPKRTSSLIQKESLFVFLGSLTQGLNTVWQTKFLHCICTWENFPGKIRRGPFPIPGSLTQGLNTTWQTKFLHCVCACNIFQVK